MSVPGTANDAEAAEDATSKALPRVTPILNGENDTDTANGKGFWNGNGEISATAYSVSRRDLYPMGFSESSWQLPLIRVVSPFKIRVIRGKAVAVAASAASAVTRPSILQKAEAAALDYGIAVLLTNASRVPSGDHDGTLIVPWPPYTYAMTRAGPPSIGINRSRTCL